MDFSGVCMWNEGTRSSWSFAWGFAPRFHNRCTNVTLGDLQSLRQVKTRPFTNKQVTFDCHILSRVAHAIRLLTTGLQRAAHQHAVITTLWFFRTSPWINRVFCKRRLTCKKKMLLVIQWDIFNNCLKADNQYKIVFFSLIERLYSNRDYCMTLLEQ